jgi:hypothetical protein
LLSGSRAERSDRAVSHRETDGEKIRAREAAEKKRSWLSYDAIADALTVMFDEVERPTNRAELSQLPAARRLALEMALHESTEQRAIDGELASLEAAWREAEEIAGIADDLLLPDSVTARIAGPHAPTSGESGRG